MTVFDKEKDSSHSKDNGNNNEDEQDDLDKTLEVFASTCLPDAFDLWKEKYRLTFIITIYIKILFG